MNQNGGIHKGGFAVLCHRNGGSESPGILIWRILAAEESGGSKVIPQFDEMVQDLDPFF